MNGSSDRRHSTAAAVERWRTGSPSGSERRKLSFNPVSEWGPPAAPEEPRGAFEVSRTKRVLQVGIAVIYCLLAAGIVFGFAALKPVLVKEGVYKDTCTKQEIEEGVWVCYEQELRLNLMFTVAAVSTNVCALPVGTILDRYGPRIASIIGVVFLTLGSLSMAFAGDLPFDAYIPGYLFLALGGPFVFIPSFQLSNTFPRNSGLILALLTGAFDTSSAVFLVYRLTYQKTNGTFTLKKFFLIYLIVPALILLAQLFVMPTDSYKTVGELAKTAEDPAADGHVDNDVNEETALLGSNSDKQQKAEEEKAARSGVWGALHGRTAWQQIRTPWFVLITLFTVIQMTRINYFVATIRTQYTELLHSHAAAVRINEFFDVALPLGGVIAVPFIGFVLDYTSTPFVLGLLVTIATAIGILGLVPQMWAGYANVCLFVVYRPLYYTAVSDYSAKVFGFATFGKVYGLIICLAGLFNFTQQGLDALTHKTFHNDPVPVNALLLCLAAFVGVLLVGYVTRRSYMMGREKLEEEAEGAREVTIPNAHE
ncbi:hypothetical protein BAUCODRAFT_354347 [Baudoinia panamericana UAMH 10762]|uniref:Major facilitator superfamily (MFS) profile domain-containing protein n=1 Tax=Baudoinia panamericana (strain UAMH 10762) TaxID=717646 RepID=M2MSP0_BAUPA|nr:uncharacterized protein BAUCODRAFT_354347 [Baudoinia panamericana UAMH 10762]EMC99896.1 hypothetical protein BAUCODRAFT_354347 [Baudoinia panamericana UAMH 10762]